MDSIIFIALIILVIAFLYLLSQPGSYEVRRSIAINRNIDEVFNTVRNYQTWQEWSPWMIHEPNAQITFSENCEQQGGSYEWDGKRVGAGKLTHLVVESPNYIEDRIEFFRPFKSVGTVKFELQQPEPEQRRSSGTCCRASSYAHHPVLLHRS